MIGKRLLQVLRFLDRDLEKWILVAAFAFCGAIVAVEVFRRYVFAQQAAWTTTIPSYLFLWLTWLGASYCIRQRVHLSFDELRVRFPRPVQFMLLMTDYVLYIAFACLVVYWSFDLLGLHLMMESTVPGTNNIPSWWFYSATPVGFTLIIVRVIQCAVEDIAALRSGQPFQLTGKMLVLD
ncbi:MAG: TRAP transporter small permease [Hyphomicrobiales bacterium]